MAQSLTWEDLRDIFYRMLGSRNVYYQPPSTVKLSYPCIIFDLSKIDTKRADNRVYNLRKRYDVTYISRRPDEPIVEDILTLPYCSLDRTYIADNLYHYIYTLYF